MEVTAALRRIKRQFGDEYNVAIIDAEIYDWIHDAELDIIRATSDNDLTLPIPSTSFPVSIPDRVNIKRLAVNNKSLMNITQSQLDLMSASVATSGDPSYWYFQGGQVNLWPVPDTNSSVTVAVTYSKTPSQMTVIAPYLQWSNNPPSLQVAQVASDNDWKNSTSVNVAVEMTFDALINSFRILSCGVGTDTAVDTHFRIDYAPTGPNNRLVFSVSNGTAFLTLNMDFLVPFKIGEQFKFRIAYNAATGTAYLYKLNYNTGVEVLQGSTGGAGVFNKQIAAVATLFLGNRDYSTPPTVAPAFRMSSLELRYAYQTDPLTSGTVFLFDGENDLTGLFAPTANFTSASSHPVTTIGNLVVAAYNQFTVPEVFHEDVVKYCLARAHNKNMNFRASEAEMEQYDRRVSTRRNEAQATDTALYKIPDADDYADYGYY